jgi:hypothetical protein
MRGLCPRSCIRAQVRATVALIIQAKNDAAATREAGLKKATVYIDH